MCVVCVYTRKRVLYVRVPMLVTSPAPGVCLVRYLVYHMSACVISNIIIIIIKIVVYMICMYSDTRA